MSQLSTKQIGFRIIKQTLWMMTIIQVSIQLFSILCNLKIISPSLQIITDPYIKLGLFNPLFILGISIVAYQVTAKFKRSLIILGALAGSFLIINGYIQYIASSYGVMGKVKNLNEVFENSSRNIIMGVGTFIGSYIFKIIIDLVEKYINFNIEEKLSYIWFKFFKKMAHGFSLKSTFVKLISLGLTIVLTGMVLLIGSENHFEPKYLVLEDNPKCSSSEIIVHLPPIKIHERYCILHKNEIGETLNNCIKSEYSTKIKIDSSDKLIIIGKIIKVDTPEREQNLQDQINDHSHNPNIGLSFVKKVTINTKTCEFTSY